VADTDWMQLGFNAASAVASAAAGVVVGAWRWGRRTAHREHAVKADYDGKIDALREEMRSAMSTAARSRSEIADEFRDTFQALRQKINSVELEAERRFLLKEDFNDFREEYRENTNRIFDKLDDISRSSQ
jgi:GTPase SAR1 family protein